MSGEKLENQLPHGLRKLRERLFAYEAHSELCLDCRGHGIKLIPGFMPKTHEEVPCTTCEGRGRTRRSVSADIALIGASMEVVNKLIIHARAEYIRHL